MSVLQGTECCYSLSALIHTVEIGRALKCCLEHTLPDLLAQKSEQSNYRARTCVFPVLFAQVRSHQLLQIGLAI